ncbi:hypothetical protein ITI46_18630 [Streptomyces oryzae]|uniref:Uncharacterized protein n=1 Tax=Streptomyces oryzae TaxID=1434886 RepID=A0ABS3XE37_9ACTN|nr:hypothetical protein [Streptomyces oryzae]MBO8193661.1 hypothetical protein [Streptomyces oryzae]
MNAMNIGFAEAASYLTRASWHPVMRGPLAEIWQPTDEDSVRIMVPKNSNAPDFEPMIRNLTVEVGRHEGRDPAHVREDIARQFLDITKLRAASEDEINDTIPMRAGIALFESAKRLVTASAGSTLFRQGNFGRNMPRRAINHAKNVRLGHTMTGSYILPIITSAAVPEIYEFNEGLEVQPSLDIEVEESRFDRRVVTTMAHALEVLEEIAVTRDSMPTTSEINDAVAEGVSRELCDAISSVLTTGHVENYDVTFQWAPAATPPIGLTDKVVFPRETEFTVREIAEQLKSSERVEEQVIFGIIVNLMAYPNDGTGRVTIKSAIQGRVRNVNFDLDWESYRRASQYHTERRPVFVRGVLHVPSGRQATMEVSAFGPDPSTMTLDDALQPHLATMTAEGREMRQALERRETRQREERRLPRSDPEGPNTAGS